MTGTSEGVCSVLGAARPKLIYLITEDWFFCSHFINRAVAARDAGFDVVVAAREASHGDRIREAGLRLIDVDFRRRSMNLRQELMTIAAIWRIYRQEKPDIVHQIASKPILYGSIVARFLGRVRVVNAPVGMGYVFSSDDGRARLLRPLVRLGYWALLNPPGGRVIYENQEDRLAAIAAGAVRARDALLIRGAGVDVDGFRLSRKPNHPPTITLMARMLRDKGVGELIRAAQLLHERGVRARILLVGDPDPANPASISAEELKACDGRWGIEWLGWRGDVAAILAQSDIACLPSYREGLPKSLIEAAAAGLPIVTTDTVGCREVVEHGRNGLLVPVRDAEGLAAALEVLIGNPELRRRMGVASRELAVHEFASTRIITETLSVYRACMAALHCK